MQSAALCLSFWGRLGYLNPCHARVRRRICRAALVVARVTLVSLILGCLGRGLRCRRRGILIVDRLYYRIISLGFLLLCLRSSLLFLPLLLL